VFGQTLETLTLYGYGAREKQSRGVTEYRRIGDKTYGCFAAAESPTGGLGYFVAGL